MKLCHNFENFTIPCVIIISFLSFATYFFTEKNSAYTSVEEENCFSQPVSHKKVTWWSNRNTESFKCFPSDLENILKCRKRSETPDPSNSNQDSKAKGSPTSASQGQASLTLASNQVYKFKSEPVGYFRIRGGHTGNITVVGHQVSIWDAQDNLIFSEGSTNDRVEVTDDLKTHLTTITLISGEEGEGNDEIGNLWENSENIIIINGIDYSTPSSKRKHDGDIKNSGPLQIVGHPNEQIILRGGNHRTAIVSGNGGHLNQAGKKSVTVFGNLQSATQSGSTGSLKVNGNVEGTVSQIGMDSMTIVGNVGGNVRQLGIGNVKVVGNVKAWVEQKGVGNIEIYGDVGEEGGNGGISQKGVGRIKIVGNVWKSVETKGVGSIEINGDVVGGIRSSGAGSVEIKGDVGGDIRSSGLGSVRIKGRLMNAGRIFKQGFGQVYVGGKEI